MGGVTYVQQLLLNLYTMYYHNYFKIYILQVIKSTNTRIQKNVYVMIFLQSQMILMKQDYPQLLRMSWEGYGCHIWKILTFHVTGWHIFLLNLQNTTKIICLQYGMKLWKPWYLTPVSISFYQTFQYKSLLWDHEPYIVLDKVKLVIDVLECPYWLIVGLFSWMLSSVFDKQD